MLFKDKLKLITKELSSEYDKLFYEILKTQSHDSDMLLVFINGFYSPITNKSLKGFSPYVIGPNKDGHSYSDHYEFIHKYRTESIHELTLKDYLKECEWTSERSKKIDELVAAEKHSIQLEMLIYLKIWESDTFIKQYYQLINLLNGEPYDWHFQIANSSRDKDTTGTRDVLIRKKIRDKLKIKFPKIYSAFKTAYITQVRNSIAHSNYSFAGRNIHLNNDVENDPYSQLKNIEFNNWIEMFHNTMIIYNELLRLNNVSSG